MASPRLCVTWRCTTSSASNSPRIRTSNAYRQLQVAHHRHVQWRLDRHGNCRVHHPQHQRTSMNSMEISADPNPVLLAYRQLDNDNERGEFLLELLSLLGDLNNGVLPDLRIVLMVLPEEIVHAKDVIVKHLILIGK